MGSQENYFGSVGRSVMIIILSFRVGTSKNKNIDHGVEETCAIRSTLDMKSITALYLEIQQYQVD